MIDRNKLNRIQGVLSARQGAEIPKFLGGAKFAKQDRRGTIIYSNDGLKWFTDKDLTQSYDLGGMEDFYDMLDKINPVIIDNYIKHKDKA